ncbi:MAG: hypothetical protein ABS45_15680 [Comamonas sp. SCN 65-56]|uniref:hypothetical protein n=1 Tax=Comamonas sp. SCN 65-56 TaxID=1660095 RepID=UPI00086950AE|nr:hypothetical protein [Comamonas sp. SCN 65-56]ODS90493.1 MAG: hypothetical protein ABS45_15680 [Comamonas sp. SCN 65-56]
MDAGKAPQDMPAYMASVSITAHDKGKSRGQRPAADPIAARRKELGLTAADTAAAQCRRGA